MDFQLLIGNTEILEGILIVIFLLAFVIQLGYYLLIYLQLPLYNPGKKRKTRKGVSVIICAKNEEENLERFLPRILEQDYPEFEVVVVNDCSTDDTELLLARLSTSYEHLRFTC